MDVPRRTEQCSIESSNTRNISASGGSLRKIPSKDTSRSSISNPMADPAPVLHSSSCLLNVSLLSVTVAVPKKEMFLPARAAPV